ncbi:MAG TPA: type II toxin-antitoxin system RelE/ParE family toxin [Longimicrobiaceae bacterium]|nr:type II toxin-antitoxin system RelE/ParE family toxin [Longimicrobiaceae bacterium]
MTRLVLLRAAQADIRKAALFYKRQARHLSTEFTAEIERALSRVAEDREISSPMRQGARKLLVRRFPYLIIYHVLPDHVLVLAVGHQRRHPDFWLDRG